MSVGEFSFRTREESLRRFREETFDLLIIGGGITGAAVARDASMRGLRVAVVDKNDFAWGTSSRSSKLIHGGLRYLENFEFGLVFEALAERALLLKTTPHMVRPLPFYLPVFKEDRNGKGILDLGLWLYDLLALFRAPGVHKRLSKKGFLEQIPFIKQDGLKGGFRYFDASMWDDVLVLETLRSAHTQGAAIANYVEAVGPLWKNDRIEGFRVRDREQLPGKGEIDLKAHRVVVCAGPWTDLIGQSLSPNWKTWLNPSKGVHLIFDLKRLPIPGAMVMNNPADGRISFVIPRPDFGAGVVIVGTTDAPSGPAPEIASIEASDVQYLMDLLRKYFPTLDLKTSDILSAYVGVRPLMAPVVPYNDLPPAASPADEGKGGLPVPTSAKSLQKVSREHHIGKGPGGTVLVAGGKYTTHRKMAEEIVEYTLKAWQDDAKLQKAPSVPEGLKKPNTKSPVNPRATSEATDLARTDAANRGITIPVELLNRYGAEALEILALATGSNGGGAGLGQRMESPDGFPELEAQLRHNIRTEMVLHLEDFFFRRIPLFAARADHGLPWAEMLAKVWADERGLGEVEAQRELEHLKAEIERRSAWQKNLDLPVTEETENSSL